MTPEDQLLFACVRPHFSDGADARTGGAQRDAVLALCRTHTMDWASVYATAEMHGVAPLVYAALRQGPADALGMPPALVARFEQVYFHSLIAQKKIAERIVTVLAFLNQSHTDVMLVKGGALDLFVYAHPGYTTLNDIDLIFRLEQAQMTGSAAPGFLDEFQDIHFEYDYFTHHDVTMNGMLPVDFGTIWRDAVEREVGGERVWVMSPEDLLIATCINSCRKRFFRLKALRDLSEILHRYPDLDWVQVVRKAQAYQCTAIVYAALVVAAQTMGLTLPDDVLEKLQVPSARAAVIRYLSRHMSFCALNNLYAGSRVFGREAGRGLLLPYATYRFDQLWKRLKFVSNPRFRRTSPLPHHV